jgi:hypothetical protein
LAKGNPDRETQGETSTRPQQPPQQPPQQLNWQQLFTFILALVVIVAFLFFYGFVVYVFPGKADLRLISSTLGNIVASIIGYYFGQRPVQAANQAAKLAEETASKAKEEYSKTNVNLAKELEQHQATIAGLTNQLISLNEENKRLKRNKVK